MFLFSDGLETVPSQQIAAPNINITNITGLQQNISVTNLQGMNIANLPNLQVNLFIIKLYFVFDFQIFFPFLIVHGRGKAPFFRTLLIWNTYKHLHLITFMTSCVNLINYLSSILTLDNHFTTKGYILAKFGNGNCPAFEYLSL